jgi:hypothetical protein
LEPVIAQVVAPRALMAQVASTSPILTLSLRNMKFPSYPVEQLLVMAMRKKSTENGSLRDASDVRADALCDIGVDCRLGKKTPEEDSSGVSTLWLLYCSIIELSPIGNWRAPAR